MPRSPADHDVYLALADANRRRILDLLSDSDQTVSSIVDAGAVSQPTVSEHLRILRTVGLVTVRKQGRQRIYRLVPTALAEARAWLTRLNTSAPSPLLTSASDDGHGAQAGCHAKAQRGHAADAPSGVERPTGVAHREAQRKREGLTTTRRRPNPSSWSEEID